MPRSWSYRKVTGYASQAERTKAQNRSAGAFMVGIVVVILIFSSVMVFVGVKAMTHPSIESHLPTAQNP